MKKLLISFLAVFLLTGCTCTLHTHYYNDYGVCACGASIAQELKYENEEYNSPEYSVEANEYYYYKFQAHGENGIVFTIISDSNVTFDRIEIRGDGILQTIASPYQDGKYYHDRVFTSGNNFYLKISYYGSGTIKLNVTEK